jgi:hypothetical protein
LVVLGLVTTKGRVDEAAKCVPYEQCAVSRPTVAGNAPTYQEEVAKLRLIVETATEIWGESRSGAILGLGSLDY